jgi:hypothetical protein
MGAQYISRHIDDRQVKKITIEGRPQVSLNSDGHLVIRISITQNDDELIVFDEQTTRLIIAFCQQKLANFSSGTSELPF